MGTTLPCSLWGEGEAARRCARRCGRARVERPGRRMGAKQTAARAQKRQGRVVPHGYYPPLLSLERRGGGEEMRAPLGGHAGRTAGAAHGRGGDGGEGEIRTGEGSTTWVLPSPALSGAEGRRRGGARAVGRARGSTGRGGAWARRRRRRGRRKDRGG